MKIFRLGARFIISANLADSFLPTLMDKIVEILGFLRLTMLVKVEKEDSLEEFK